MKPAIIIFASIIIGSQLYARNPDVDTVIIQNDTSICAGNSLTLSINFAPVTGRVIFPPGSDYEYSFSMPAAGWTTQMGNWPAGDAPFGNATDENPPEFDYYTFWPANVPDHPDGYDLYLRKEIDLTGYDLTNIHWYMGVDNGYALYLNGILISSAFDGGYTYRWEYEGVLPPALLNPGNNIIAIALKDNGGLTAFDMMLQSLPHCPCPTILWSTGETTTSIHVSPAVTTKYFVTITDGANLTRDSISITVNHNSRQVINASICEGQSYAGHTRSGNYADSFITKSGCDSIILLQLTVMPKPKPELGPPSAICTGDSLVLFPGLFESYTWQDGSHQNQLIVKQSGLYTVEVTNNCGSATSQVQVTANECELVFPSAFTPDGNGLNDLFKILNAHGLTDYRLSVYNRWGQIVFETKDPSTGWNGVFNGRIQDTGVYAWFCNFKKSGIVRTMKGTVVLIK